MTGSGHGVEEEAFLQAHLSAARITLEAVVAAGKQFAPMIVVIRGGMPVTGIIPPSGDGVMIYRIAQLAADGYLADEIIMLSDVYAAGKLLNPLTGAVWKRGEMEDLAANHQGVERGWVRDALLLVCVRRTGGPSMLTVPYRRVDGTVTWLDNEVTGRSGGGYLPGGMLTRVMEPSGLFEPGEARPEDEVFSRFLEGLGAEVL